MEPERIGRVVITNKSTPSYGRVLEAIEAINKIGSPCMIVTDADKKEFPEHMEVFTTPTPKYFWMNPLVQHIPFDMVSGYIATFKGGVAYRGDDERYNEPPCSNRLKDGTEIVVL